MEIVRRVMELMLMFQLHINPTTTHCMVETKRMDIKHRQKICLIEKHLIKQESNGNPYAKSHKGAIGLYQIMPATYREMAPKVNAGKDMYNIENNTKVGRAYLDYCFKQFDGDIALALSCYNAGPNKVKQLRTHNKKTYKDIKHRLPRETQHYVERILVNIKRS